MRFRPALLLADVGAVLVFAAMGRRSHTEGVSVGGVLHTAWPFLTGAVVGWLATRAWRRPAVVAPVGVVTWVCAVAGGLLLRRLTGNGTAWPFVVVATLVLAALLLGWRAVAHVARRQGAGT